MKSDGKVVISTALNNKGLQKDIGNIAGSFGGLKSVLGKLTGLITTAFSVHSIIRFGVESSKAAMELSNALIGLQSIVEGQGRSFSKAKTFLDEYVKDGLIPMSNAATAYKNLVARGYDDSQVQQTLIALKNASAFGRQASYSMGEAVQSATEGLKNENSILVDNAGVTKNVSKMWDEYAKSIGTTAANLTQEQKIQAEVAGILEESRFQTGDAAKVAGTLSGQLSQLSYNFNSLKVAIGNAINPVVQTFLPTINTAVVAVTRFANSIASLMATITGKSVSISTGANAVADGYSEASESAKDLEKATTAAGKAAKKSLAGFDEINKLNDASSGGSAGPGGLTTTAEVTPSVGGGVKTALNELSGVFEKLKQKIQDGDWFGAGVIAGEALTEGIQSLDWKAVGSKIGEIIGGAFSFSTGFLSGIDFGDLYQSYMGLWAGLLDSASDAIQKMDWEQVGRSIIDLLVSAIAMCNPVTAILYMILTPNGRELLKAGAKFAGSVAGALLKAMIGAGKEIGKIASEIWTTVKDHFDAYVDWEGTPGEIIAGLFKGIVDALSAIKEWIKKNVWEPFVEGFCEAAGIDGETSQGMKAFGNILIEGLCSGVVTNIDMVKQACKEVWETIQEPFTGVSDWFESTFSDAWDKIVSVWEGAASWFNENVIVPLQEFWAPIGEWFSELFGSIEQTLSDVFYNIGVIAEGCWQIIQYAWEVASGWFDEKVIQPLKENFEAAWFKLSSLAAAAWGRIKEIVHPWIEWFDEKLIEPLKENFSKLWNGFKEKATEAWEKVKGAFSGIAQWAKGILNEFIRALNSGLSKIFSGINSGLGKLRDLHIGELQPFANISRISAPQIPYLAQGAVLPANKPFLAMVGDQKHGTNIEAPLATIQEAVAMVMQDQTQAILAGFEASVGVQREILEAVLGIQIGDDVIGNAVARYSRKQAVMRGGAL